MQNLITVSRVELYCGWFNHACIVVIISLRGAEECWIILIVVGTIILLDQSTDLFWIIFYWKDGNQIQIAAPYHGLQKTEYNAGSCIFYLSSEFL
jgi:hypothetical protein